MNIRIYIILLVALLSFTQCTQEKKSDDWIELFNGKDLSNWKANENANSFKVVDGMIVANGLRSHLFYTGDGDQAVNFKNFELSMDVMTHHLANSGLYFHTAPQKEGWLEQGYEVQINSTHHGAGDYKEVKKGGSLYGVRNLYKAVTKDSVWHNLNVRVDGKHVQIKINDQLVVDYLEPTDASIEDSKKRLSAGNFALQGHDVESTVFFKNIKVKVLEDRPEKVSSSQAEDTAPAGVLKYQGAHFAFIDEHIHTGESFKIDSAIQSFYKTGINLGLVVDVEKLPQGEEDKALMAHIKKYGHLPVFLGIFRNNLKELENVPPSTISQFDYVIGDITSFKNSKGQDVDILKNENIGEREAFMNAYTKAITVGLDKGGLDIWATATLLPESLSAEYDKLWTNDRMTEVIEAAKRNNVAIEVYNKLKIPSIKFLKLAKEKGCAFSIGGLFKENEMAEPDYFYDVIEQCKLDYKDVYIPRNSN